jgi:hypothetical protein
MHTVNGIVKRKKMCTKVHRDALHDIYLNHVIVFAGPSRNLIFFQLTAADLGHDMYLRGLLPFLKEAF